MPERRPTPSKARAAFVACAAFALLLLAPSRAHAYAWMIKHSYGSCVTCHADPSGGELLTEYGRAQGDLLLRMRYSADDVSAKASQRGGGGSDSFDSFDEDFDVKGGAAQEQQAAPAATAPESTQQGPSPTAGFLWGLVDLPDFLLLGGSYRHMNILEPSGDDVFTTFPMQMDLYGHVQFGAFRAGGTLGLSHVPAGSPHARAAQITTGQGHDWNLLSRTHWLGLDIGEKYTLRAGRLNVPFGVRIPEHVAWVREATRTDRESDQQHGVALAYNGDFLRAEVMAIAGNYQINPDIWRERGYSFFVEALVTDRMGVGLSSLLTVASADLVSGEDESTTRQAHGAFGRLTLADPLVLLVEADALLKSRRGIGYVGFAQLDWEFVQGLHGLLTGEIRDDGLHDEAEASVGQGQPRLGAWLGVDWFFLPHMEARIEGVVRQEDPFQIWAQLHVYL